MKHYPVVVVGGGLAGLTCANYLFDAGKPFLLIEAGEKTGGRVKTVVKDGFLLDVGFQVFLSSYQEAKALLDYESLDLKYFKSGANIFWDGKWHKFVNPLKDPLALLSAIASPVGTIGDKMKVLSLNAKTKHAAQVLNTQDSNLSTIEYLRNWHFSDQYIKRFFQPFFGGVFLDKSLSTPANFFQFLFQQFYRSDAGLPATGMQAIAAQLTENLPPEQVLTGVRVSSIDGQTLHLSNMETITANKIVLATDYTTAKHLQPQLPWHDQQFNGTICLYYSAPPQFESGRLLRIVAEPGFLINNLAVLDEVASDYSPNEKRLVSVTLLEGDDLPENQLLNKVQQEFAVLFGHEMASHFHFLHRFDIPEALPAYRGKPNMKSDAMPGLILAGDYLEYPSINGAMLSGRLAAKSILEA